MDIADINKDIGKLAERMGKVETKISGFEEYVHLRHHDTINMIQQSDAKSHLHREELAKKIGHLEDVLVAHKDAEERQVKAFGKWLIRCLIAGILGLAGYVWKIKVG